ncbi:expressed unknown protein [Seminavis robusta]|uniref:Uncharacterized protein n=1 Tax=Seminavis robusta TaxID=568900 RepID=A0A9N8HIC2_9STRA|nr:expressed unknown protein [Seminavis robusta]|eukprot:Sro616_g175900.1 n/a (155) ;mRNA; r:5271-5735
MGSLSKLPPEVARELRRHVSPRPLKQMAQKQKLALQKEQEQQRKGSGWVLAGCVVFTGAAFSIPFAAQQWIGNLNARDEPLTHAQVRRGAFMNSGSVDAGKDPQWDFRKGQYKKDDNYWAIFDNNAAAQTFGAIVSATGKDEQDKSKEEPPKKQ